MADVLPLSGAIAKYWEKCSEITGARVVQKRFLDGSIVTFAFSRKRDDRYWDRFVESFDSSIEIDGETFEIKLEPISVPSVSELQECACVYERAYRMCLCSPSFLKRLLARLKSVFGAQVELLTFRYATFRENENGEYGQTHSVIVSSVQRYTS